MKKTFYDEYLFIKQWRCRIKELQNGILSVVIFLLSFQVFAINEIPVISESEQTEFKNFPVMNHHFRGAKNIEERDKSIQKCREWILEQLSEIPEEKVFRTWCSVKRDVIIREYHITSHIVFRF